MFVEPSTLRVSPRKITLPPPRELCIQFRSAAVVSPDAAVEPSSEEAPLTPSQSPDDAVIRIPVE